MTSTYKAFYFNAQSLHCGPITRNFAFGSWNYFADLDLNLTPTNWLKAAGESGIPETKSQEDSDLEGRAESCCNKAGNRGWK